MTHDFHINKKILEEVGQVPSKRIKNKIAGYATHIMKRIQRGPVRGISLKLQEMVIYLFILFVFRKEKREWNKSQMNQKLILKMEFI